MRRAGQRMEADKSGNLAGITRHDYAPFGEEMYAGIRRDGGGQGQYGYEPPQSNVRNRFGSKERDGETGLDYFDARYYSSIQGRFTSVDPINVTGMRMIDPQRFNLYSYTRNNPLSYTDLTGMEPESDEERRKKVQKQIEEAKKKGEELPTPTEDQIGQAINDIKLGAYTYETT